MAEELPFLSRWSRRKVEAREGGELAPEASPTLPAAPPGDATPAVEAKPYEPLPPVESLTPESDFTPFLKPGVDEGVKRQALRTLFRDPQFNIQDGLDIYIGDYTQPDPIPPEMLARLNQMSHLGIRERDPEPEEEKTVEAPAPALAATPEPAVPVPEEPAPEPSAEPLQEGKTSPR